MRRVEFEGAHRVWNGAVAALLAALAIFFFPSALADPGDYIVRNWQTDAGLPESSVTSLAQTPDGYIWCTTFGGVARFDGVRFEVFDPQNTPELPTDRWLKVGASRTGELVFVSEFRDVVVRENAKFKLCVLSNNLNNAFADDAAGHIWTICGEVATPSWQCLSGDGSFAPSGDRRIIVRNVGSWISPTGDTYYAATGLLKRATSNAWETVRLFPDEPAEFLGQLLPQHDPSGAWLVTDKKLHRFNGSIQAGLNRPALGVGADVVEDPARHEVWVGISDVGLFRCDLKDGSSERVPLPAGGSIRCLLLDREDNLWVGMSNRGLAQVRRRPMRTYGTKDGLLNSVIRSVAEDSQGNLWVCTMRGVNILQHGKMETLPAEYQQRFAWNTAPAGPGEVWMGTLSDGLFRYTLRAGQPVFQDAQLLWQDPDFTCLLTDSQGGLWFGNRSGLFRLNGTRPEKVQLPAKGEMDIRAVAEGTNGAMYAGSNGAGLFVRASESAAWQQFTRADGLASDQVYSLFADATGMVWIGMSGGGLARFDGKRIFSFRTDLPDLPRTVTGLQGDDVGYLWLGSTRGVFRVKTSELNAVADQKSDSATIFEYGVAAGMPTAACTAGIQPSVAKTKDGQIWFATMEGLVCFDPPRIPVNRLAPPVAIETVSSGKSQIDLTTLTATADAQLLQLGAAGVIAKPGADPIEFRFTGLSLSAPENVRFRYRMEGLDKEWVKTSERRAVYQRLPPGNYTFRVAGCNNDGVWNETGASLAIVQMPYYWETAWFKILIAVLGAALLYAAYRSRLAQMARVGQLRARIAADLHDEVGSNMGAIVLNSDLLTTTPNLSAGEREQIEDIHRVAQNTAHAIREISWFINPDFDFLDEMIARMKEVATRMASGIELKFAEPESVPRIRLPLEFRRNVMSLYKEALNNVVRHSGASELKIGIRFESRRLEIEIADNGRGFDPGLPGSGQGLRNLRQRAQDAKGTLEIRSSTGAGTIIRFTGNVV